MGKIRPSASKSHQQQLEVQLISMQIKRDNRTRSLRQKWIAERKAHKRAAPLELAKLTNEENESNRNGERGTGNACGTEKVLSAFGRKEGVYNHSERGNMLKMLTQRAKCSRKKSKQRTQAGCQLSIGQEICQYYRHKPIESRLNT